MPEARRRVLVLEVEDLGEPPGHGAITDSEQGAAGNLEFNGAGVYGGDLFHDRGPRVRLLSRTGT
jgi:hypothetical protein